MYQISNEKFGLFVTELRKKKNLTQKDLAEKLYVSDKTVSKWERGLSMPNVVLLIPIADILDVTVTELLRGEKIDTQKNIDTKEVEELVVGSLDMAVRNSIHQHRKNWILAYLLCFLISITEIIMLVVSRNSIAEMKDDILLVTGLMLLFGAWFCFFAKDILPTYYDANKMYQIDRIEHFTENMRKMSHLEQRELQCSEIELSELTKKIEAEAAMLSKKESKLCKVERVQEQNIVKVDEELVMEVTDNLLENAVRYAQKSIALQIKKKDGFLIISVEDDGIGFVDTEEKVTEPFYHKNPQDDLKHFGLGMYISRIFCEKHGGNLKIYNARQGGAHVEALFKAE